MKADAHVACAVLRRWMARQMRSGVVGICVLLGGLRHQAGACASQKLPPLHKADYRAARSE